ncbi:hypothetical protein D2E76_16470 [Mycobacteroides abscessus]|uniref:Uncharacterized protein n=1 Tax=Mycobacteroides abscessus TaxID=36809 RepID=A0ABD7HML1_9MYCO|nr:hypothetical protein [Mycobacteroides abscessus]RIT36845.1 hypothetical protein D2E76_16470 [Mycobacteroides abscessus]
MSDQAMAAEWHDTGWDLYLRPELVDGEPQVRIETSAYLKPGQARGLAAALLAAAETLDGAVQNAG